MKRKFMEGYGNDKDIEICKIKIKAILEEYNCDIETEDYHWCWLRDKDTDETLGLG